MLLLRLGSFLGLLVDLRLASTLPSYPLIARSSRSPLGNKIPLIENLGAAEDQYDVLDLSDNEITRVDGFPRMNRLTSLMLNNNRIASVADGLADNIPNLETLILTNNKIQNLADLDPIAELKNLHTVSFMKNEVCLKPHYRLYLIHLLPSVKIIDFRKVKYQEQKEASELFAGKQGSDLKKSIEAERSQISTTAKKENLTEEQKRKIKAAIAAASSLQEVQRLELMLQSGKMPKGFGENGSNEDKMDES